MENMRFIRKNGRIIPIRPKQSKDEIKRRNFGLGTIAVGLAVPAATTRIAHNMKRAAGRATSIFHKTNTAMKSAQTRKFIFRTGAPTLADYARREKASAKIFARGMKAGEKAAQFRKFAPHIKNIGIWTGASLIGSGLARVFEKKDEGDLSGTFKELGFTAASAAAIYGSGDAAIRAKMFRLARKLVTKGK